MPHFVYIWLQFLEVLGFFKFRQVTACVLCQTISSLQKRVTTGRGSQQIWAFRLYPHYRRGKNKNNSEANPNRLNHKFTIWFYFFIINYPLVSIIIYLIRKKINLDESCIKDWEEFCKLLHSSCFFLQYLP